MAMISVKKHLIPAFCLASSLVLPALANQWWCWNIAILAA